MKISTIAYGVFWGLTLHSIANGVVTGLYVLYQNGLN